MSVPEIPTNTQVCIIGGGPAGVIASYLFALLSVDVVLLEGKKDFNREFRENTLHASPKEDCKVFSLWKNHEAVEGL